MSDVLTKELLNLRGLDSSLSGKVQPLNSSTIPSLVDSNIANKTKSVSDVVPEVSNDQRVVFTKPGDRLGEVLNLALKSVKNGEKVLFLSDSGSQRQAIMAALFGVGLNELAVSLDNRSSNQAISEDLRRTIQLGPPSKSEIEEARSNRNALCQKLDSHLHSLELGIRRSGVSGYKALSEVIGFPAPEGDIPDLSDLPFNSWTERDFEKAHAVAKEIDTFINANGDPLHSPWKGCAVSASKSPPGVEKVEPILERLTALQGALSEFLDEVGLSSDLSEDQINAALDALKIINQIDTAYGTALQHVNMRAFKGWVQNGPKILEGIAEQLHYYDYEREFSGKINFGRLKSLDLSNVKQVVGEHLGKNFITRLFHAEYEEVLGKLSKVVNVPSKVEDVSRLVDHLVKIQNAQEKAQESADFLKSFFSDSSLFIDRDQNSDALNHWRQKAQVAEAVIAIFSKCALLNESSRKAIVAAFRQPSVVYQNSIKQEEISSLLNQYREARQEYLALVGLSEEEQKDSFTSKSLEDQLTRLTSMNLGAEAWSSWQSFLSLVAKAEGVGISSLMSQVRSGDLSRPIVADTLKYTWFNGLGEEFSNSRPGTSVQVRESDLFGKMLDANSWMLQANATLVASKHWQGIPRYDVGGQSSRLIELLADVDNPNSIEQLLSEAPAAFQHAKPIIVSDNKELVTNPGVTFDKIFVDRDTPSSLLSEIQRGNPGANIYFMNEELHRDPEIVTNSRLSEALEIDHFQAMLKEILETQYGLTVDCNLKTPFGTIDIAVRDQSDSERYLFCILLDKPSSHLGDSSVEHELVRDETAKEISYQEPQREWILEWFRDPGRQLSKFNSLIESRLRRPESHIPHEPLRQIERKVFSEKHLELFSQYKRARLDPMTLREVQRTAGQIQLEKLSEVLVAIVNQEGPLHRDELYDRYFALSGLSSNDEEMRLKIVEAIQIAVKKGELVVRDDCMYSAEISTIQPRIRGRLKGDSARFDRIPPDELQSAIYLLVKAAHGLKRTEVIPQLCRALGYQGMPFAADKIIEASYREMKSRGVLFEIGDVVNVSSNAKLS